MIVVDRTTYHMYYDRPLRIERAPDGTTRGLLLDWGTGEFVPADEWVLYRLSIAGSTADISTIDADEFAIRAEEVRADRLTGDGPVFALYAAVDALHTRRNAERRRLSEDEVEVIVQIRRRTFALWQQEQERRARGEQPTFTARLKDC